MNELVGLFLCGLAPLNVRRDIALLGLIHRAVLGIGATHFADFFRCSGAQPPAGGWNRHRFQLVEYEDDVSSNALSYGFGHGRGELRHLWPAVPLAW